MVGKGKIKLEIGSLIFVEGVGVLTGGKGYGLIVSKNGKFWCEGRRLVTRSIKGYSKLAGEEMR